MRAAATEERLEQGGCKKGAEKHQGILKKWPGRAQRGAARREVPGGGAQGKQGSNSGNQKHVE